MRSNPIQEAIQQAHQVIRESREELMEDLVELVYQHFEKVRKSLPPLKMPLPEPYDTLFEFVSASRRNKAYWRWKAEYKLDISKASPAQLTHYINFARKMMKVRGMTGTYKLKDGRRIPVGAYELMTDPPGKVEEGRYSIKEEERKFKNLRKVMRYGLKGLFR